MSALLVPTAAPAFARSARLAASATRSGAALPLQRKVQLHATSSLSASPRVTSRLAGRQPVASRLLTRAVSDETGSAPVAQDSSNDDKWEIKYLYDGDCALCRSMKGMLERNDEGKGVVKFVNIADLDYEPEEHEGIEYEDAMDTIHAVRRNGEVITGPEALRALYSAVGMGWYGELSSMPIISDLIDLLYEIISKLRLPIGKGMDAIIAAKRLKMSQEGKDTCGEHEECDAPEW